MSRVWLFLIKNVLKQDRREGVKTRYEIPMSGFIVGSKSI